MRIMPIPVDPMDGTCVRSKTTWEGFWVASSISSDLSACATLVSTAPMILIKTVSPLFSDVITIFPPITVIQYNLDVYISHTFIIEVHDKLVDGEWLVMQWR